MTDASLESEIKKLDKNLELLLGECIENDLSETQVYQLIKENVCRKATRKVKQMRRTKSLLAFGKIFFATLLLSYLLTRKPITTDMLKMFGRRMLISIQPYHDWSQYYETRCFVRNADYETAVSSKRPANCNLCESLTGCELVNSAEGLADLTDLINHHRPAVVLTSKLPMADHNPIFGLTLERLASFFLALDYEDKVCMFESSLNFGSAFDLLAQVTNQTALFAHFENCGYPLRKKLRRLYDIPDFMPMMLEFTRENWFLIAQHYRSSNFKRIHIAPGTKLAVLVQIAGSTRVRLNPKTNCLSTCARIEETVNEKDLLIFSTSSFDMEYLPSSRAKLNLAFLMGATY